MEIYKVSQSRYFSLTSQATCWFPMNCINNLFLRRPFDVAVFVIYLEQKITVGSVNSAPSENICHTLVYTAPCNSKCWCYLGYALFTVDTG